MPRFKVVGKPIAQGRPRHTKSGIVYDPKLSKEWKKVIAWTVRAESPKLIEGAVKMTLKFIFARPKSHYDAKGEIKSSAPNRHTRKPDLDNLTKVVKDALEGICYRNDSQIAVMELKKTYYGDTGYTLIEVEKLGIF